jgi:hypothetical protein
LMSRCEICIFALRRIVSVLETDIAGLRTFPGSSADRQPIATGVSGQHGSDK